MMDKVIISFSLFGSKLEVLEQLFLNYSPYMENLFVIRPLTNELFIYLSELGWSRVKQ